MKLLEFKAILEVWCIGCWNWKHFEKPVGGFKEARRRLKRLGWQRKQGSWYCQMCAEHGVPNKT